MREGMVRKNIGHEASSITSKPATSMAEMLGIIG